MASYDDDDYEEIISNRDTFEDHHEVIPSKHSQDDYSEMIPNRFSWIDDDDDDITAPNTYARHHPPRNYDELVYAPPPMPELARMKTINPLKHKIIAWVAIIGYFAWVTIRLLMVFKK